MGAGEVGGGHECPAAVDGVVGGQRAAHAADAAAALYPQALAMGVFGGEEQAGKQGGGQQDKGKQGVEDFFQHGIRCGRLKGGSIA